MTPRARLIALITAALASGVLFIAGIATESLPLRLITKPIPIIALIVWVTMLGGGVYGRWIQIGLVASIAGDVLLELGPELFLPGVAAFLLAHLAYIAAYVSDARALRPARLLPFAAYCIAFYVLILPGLGGMALPVAAYTAAICTMAWRAAARLGCRGPIEAVELTGLAGAIIFAASDSLIAINRFYLDEPSIAVRYAIIVLYWAGQLGIAASVRRPASHDHDDR